MFIQPYIGLLTFVVLAWLLSENRKQLDWRIILVCLTLQLLVAMIMLWVPVVQNFFLLLNHGVSAISRATEAGTGFLFGYLGVSPGTTAAYPFEVTNAGSTYIVAFRVLPLILFFTVLSALLWYLRVLPLIIRGFALLLQSSLGVGGAVGVSTAANVFLGMVEAPILIKPYIKTLTRSELFVVMTCGMSTVAGSVMVLYSVILQSVLDNALGHILTASLISAPAAIMVARIMIPGSTQSEMHDDADAITYYGLMDAISRGTQDGLRLMVNVGAMLIVLISLVALVNSMLGLLPEIGGEVISLEVLFGYLFAPLAWLMGIPWQESALAGSLLGTKTVLNELLAYIQLSALEPGSLSLHSRLIMTYALCGFANFGSLGIMIGGLCAMCPERRPEIVELAPRSLISGTIATCMTGTIVGILL